MKNVKIFSILRLFLFLVLINSLCVSTFAESAKTCTVDLPIAIIAKSENISKDATVEIEIIPSNGTTKLFTLKHSDKNTKISIEFNKAGNYRYTIKQKSCSDSNVKLDATIYTVNILIDDNGKELVSAMSITKNEKTDLVKFENSIIEDDTPTSTTTSNIEEEPPITESTTSTPDIDTDVPNTEDTNITTSTEPDIDYNDTVNTPDNNNSDHDTNPETGFGISYGLLVAYGIFVFVAIILKNRKGNFNGRKIN